MHALIITLALALQPVADTWHSRSDAWERELLIIVNDGAELQDVQVLYAVTGCDTGAGYVAAVEIDGELVEQPDAIAWSAGDSLNAARVAALVCGGAL